MNTARNLRLLWLAQFISVAGDFLFRSSALFLVLNVETENAAFKSGVTSLLCTLPYLVFGPVAGAIADRFDRKRLMIACDLARAVPLLLSPWLYDLGVLNWIGVGVLGFVLATFSAMFNPARDAFLGEVAHGEDLVKANAYVQSSFLIAMIVGTIAAGSALSAQASSGVPETKAILRLFAINGAAFLGSLVCLLLVRREQAVLSQHNESMFASAREGLRYIAKSPLLFPLLLLSAIDNFFIMGPATVGANLLIKDTFQRGAGYVAWFECALAVGWLVGTAALFRRASTWPKGKLLLFGILMDGATFIPMIALNAWPSWPLALALIFIHGLFIPAITVSRASIIHESIPREFHGRVFSMVNLTVVGSMSLSAVATGFVGELVSPPALYLIAGIGGTTCGIAGFVFCSTLRAKR